MRIGVDCRPLLERYRTGVGEYTYQLITTLQSLPTEHEFIFYYSGRKGVIPFPLFTHLALPNKLISASTFFFSQPHIDVVMKKKKTPVDLFFSPNLNFTSISPACRYVLTIHDLSFELQRKWYTRRQRLWHRMVRPREQCHRADAVLVPSESTKQDVVNVYGVDPQKVHVAYPGVVTDTKDTASLEQVQKKYTLPSQFFLYLGTIEPRKNVDGIIEAFRLFKTRYPSHPAKLVLAGAWGWRGETVRSLVDKTPDVQYIGYVDAQDKPALYQLASAFVYPSFYEGFGLPVVEAMGYGLPVIASNRSSLPEVTQGEATLINPYDIGEIAEAMTDVLQDARRVTAPTHQWQKTAETFLSVISHI